MPKQSSLMAAFEQSLTTLNTRLRQLTTLNDKKDKEIEELREQVKYSTLNRSSEQVSNGSYTLGSAQVSPQNNAVDDNNHKSSNITISEIDSTSEEQNLIKIIEDLKRQLIEKDRLLTDTRLEALSAAHQLEQLESKLNGEHSLLANDDDLDEGVMVVNHSPSDSDAITDSAHFSEINTSHMSRSNRRRNDNISFTQLTNNNNNNNADSSPENNNTDDQSNHSSDYQVEVKHSKDQHIMSESFSQQFNENCDPSEVMGKLMDNLLITN